MGKGADQGKTSHSTWRVQCQLLRDQATQRMTHHMGGFPADCLQQGRSIRRHFLQPNGSGTRCAPTETSIIENEGGEFGGKPLHLRTPTGPRDPNTLNEQDGFALSFQFKIQPHTASIEERHAARYPRTNSTGNGPMVSLPRVVPFLFVAVGQPNLAFIRLPRNRVSRSTQTGSFLPTSTDCGL